MKLLSPSELGFRMPAEWEPQEAIWLSWPHRKKTWPGAFDEVPGVFADIAYHISESQKVRINVKDQAMADSVRELLSQRGCDLSNVFFHLNPTNDAWVRDHGPIYIVNDAGERAILNWDFNAWGEKYVPYDSDNAVPERIAVEFQERMFKPNMILEGGSIEVNGLGTLMTSESCLLNPNRNPELTRAEIEERLSKFLNVQNFIWLGAGITGDDTDGHIDDMTRFVGPKTIVTIVEQDPDDVNFENLEENRLLLNGVVDQNGDPLEVIELPMPDPVYFNNHRLPASYANFLIINDKVLVPTYRSDRDDVALSILQACFPSRTIVGIDCTALVWGLGSIHCVTQQQPVMREQPGV